MFQVDTSTPFGARVARRLREERMIWLTTVRHDGVPQPSPVWFLWDGASLLVYSRPSMQKLRNIERNPKVALNFDGNGQGGDVVVITGDAQIVSSAPAADQVPEYIAKYAPGIERIGMDPARFAQTYSVAIRITPTDLRGH